MLFSFQLLSVIILEPTSALRSIIIQPMAITSSLPLFCYFFTLFDFTSNINHTIKGMTIKNIPHHIFPFISFPVIIQYSPNTVLFSERQNSDFLMLAQHLQQVFKPYFICFVSRLAKPRETENLFTEAKTDCSHSLVSFIAGRFYRPFYSIG